MTSPTNRTDEATEAAKKAIWNWVCCNWCPTCSEKRTGKMVKEELVQAIASAITSAVEAETERCAKVAEHQATICGSSMSRQTTAHDIAFNIRQTPTKEGV